MAAYLPNSIRYYRKQNKLNQEQLAQKLDVSIGQLSRYESGESVLSSDKLLKLTSIFNVSAEELLKRDTFREVNDEGLPVIDISEGEVCRRQLFSRVNDTALTIYPDGIRFSTSCVRQWPETEFIHIVILKEEKLLIVRAREDEDRDAQRWSRMKDDRKFGRKIGGREVVIRLFDMMGWAKGFTYKISGYVGVNKDDPTEKMWYFELCDAEGYPMSHKAREKAGINDDEIDKDNLDYLDNVELLKAKEIERRKNIKAEGKPLGPMNHYVIYPDKWGQYTFGLPSQDHEIIPLIGFKT
ncbi:MAG: helix-turn-helix domain-containing protein [Lachnospiraceae bacterium]|nr:helix-turn-helix domain-containing protein [Lachnospiraceae bacterium]